MNGAAHRLVAGAAVGLYIGKKESEAGIARSSLWRAASPSPTSPGFQTFWSPPLPRTTGSSSTAWRSPPCWRGASTRRTNGSRRTPPRSSGRQSECSPFRAISFTWRLTPPLPSHFPSSLSLEIPDSQRRNKNGRRASNLHRQTSPAEPA
jgi:hypothetical protein